MNARPKMTDMTVAELKADFSRVLREVQGGAEFRVVYGRAKKPVAVLSPIGEEPRPREVGLWKGEFSYEIGHDFKYQSVEDFLEGR
jgi:antitoxin (DNA-binding transcriptional repressor) of toxin-antitoxin stability system